MAKIKLNAKAVERMKPGKGRIQVFDIEQRGLCLRVTPSGEKTFSVVYKRAGRMRRFTIGKFPDVSLADARSRARKALADVADGTDPQDEKQEVRAAGTFDELAADYMEKHSKANKTSWRDDQRMLDAYLLPKLKYMKASAVTQ